MDIVVPNRQQHVLVATARDGGKTASDVGMADLLRGQDLHVYVVVIIFAERDANFRSVVSVNVGGRSVVCWKISGLWDGWLLC